MKDKITIGKDTEQYYVELEDTGIVATGITIEDALYNLGKGIRIARKEYMKEHEKDCISDAISIKQKLLKIFEEDDEEAQGDEQI